MLNASKYIQGDTKNYTNTGPPSLYSIYKWEKFWHLFCVGHNFNSVLEMIYKGNYNFHKATCTTFNLYLLEISTYLIKVIVHFNSVTNVYLVLSSKTSFERF